MSVGTGAQQLGLAEYVALEVAQLREAGLFRTMRRVTSRNGSLVECDGRTVADFASNDYLGIASDANVSDALRNAPAGASVGAGASRLVAGNSFLHEQLEAAIAEFKGEEAAILFPSGFTANIGAIPSLVGTQDAIYADELNHASLIDACRLSRAELRVIPHSDVQALRQSLAADEGRFRRRMIVVDSVFSMDGDVYPLGELVEIAREHGVWTYVDDAHATGVLGANGRGAAEECGVEGDVDIVMGTLGKAVGVSGAFITGSRTLVDFLMHRARSFVFTTGTSPVLAAATLAALKIVREEGWRRDKLRSNARRLRDGLAALGRPANGASDAHVIPVVLGAPEVTMRVGAQLFERGFLVGAIRPPSVPPGRSRLRISMSASHSLDQIDSFLQALADCLPPTTARAQ